MAATAEAIHDVPPEPDLARIAAIVAAQREFFATGATLPLAFREEQLRKLLDALYARQADINAALHADLRKSDIESWATEIGFVTAEIKHALRKLPRWMKRRRTGFSPLIAGAARGYIHPQPLGLNLIISPWNYPVNLLLAPLTAALAAGNVAVLKPSELAPATSHVMASLIRDTFPEEQVAIIEGGVAVSSALLREPWDHIFFTGSTTVGRIVAKAGAEHLSRVTLELGGKSPAIVTASADVNLAAKRIVLGRFLNTGQTCVAPDYVLADASVHDALLDQIKASIERFFGSDPQKSPDLGRIINDRHFARLVGLIDPDKVFVGGQHDAADRYIAPTVMRDVTMDDAVMAEEIFGPVLPVLKVSTVNEAILRVQERPNPLALYLFTREAEDEQRVVDRVSFGGGCINDTLNHLADPGLPFGGVRESGLGSYHGEHGFQQFSHMKAVLRSVTFVDPSIKYPPFAGKMKVIKRLVG
jgi:aldehyde dehydrogenase (NAD+)